LVDTFYARTETSETVHLVPGQHESFAVGVIAALIGRMLDADVVGTHLAPMSRSPCPEPAR
jgi:hypothetical protein